MSRRGYVKVHRGWEASPDFRNEAYCERAAWLWLLSNAAYRPTIRVGGKGDDIAIEEGQIHVSDRSLASVWGWDKKRVRRFLARLERSKTVTSKRTANGTILTIENWAKYQVGEPTEGPTEGPTRDQRGTTHKERKEGKERKSNTREVAKPESVSDEVWADFLSLRKSKRAPVSPTALEGMRREAGKAGWSLDRAMSECVIRGWQAFKADWVKDQTVGPEVPL